MLTGLSSASMRHSDGQGLFQSYRGWDGLLAPVGDFGLIWVVCGADHGTGGRGDAAGAHGGGARLTYGQPLFFMRHRLAGAAGASLGEH